MKNLIDQNIEIEIPLLLEAIKKKYGYDFNGYSQAHVKRRILYRLQADNVKSISLLQHEVLRSEKMALKLLGDLSINVTEMFRDPDFYSALRAKVIPHLKTWSHINLWHAGCSTGEEVYSMAILLKEEGLYEKTQIYATDFNQKALDVAQEGIFPMEKMKKYTQNYNQSDPRASFSDYFLAKYDAAIMDASLKENIVWANHNLVTDTDFTASHIIFCRNVLIYFNRDLQNQVFNLFNKSLVNGGILCLGNKETIQYSPVSNDFSTVDKEQRIFKKNYAN